ncbi:MAG: type II secretion system protein GspG [Planctomycetes bacterium]|jgi:hypothetical protein|nr:type II secretion system protein GspG [Planctomycetota bacterium]
MADGSRRGERQRCFTLKGWHLIVAAVVVLVGSIGLYVVTHGDENERRIAALRAAGYPTTFAELTEYTRLPAGVANAAEVYTRAFAAFVPPGNDANVPALGKAAWPARGTPLPGPMAKAIETCLAANRPCLTLLHEAAGIEHCRYDYDYARILAPMQDIRRAAQLLHLGTVLPAARGDTATAMTGILDGLRLADSLQREPALVAYLVRISCLAVALNSLERSLSLTACTEGHLRELDAALARTAQALDFTRVMITERCAMLETCRDPSRLGPLGPQGHPLRMFPGMKGAWLTDTLYYMEAHIEATRLPPAARLKEFRRIGREIEELSFLHVMTKTAAPVFTRVLELDLRTRAGLDLARTALALERYRLASGKLPERLEDLVPQYLAQVPLDPFDAQPIRYQRTGPGYRLYSVDADGRDNGGIEKTEANRGDPYDWCFIVTR